MVNIFIIMFVVMFDHQGTKGEITTEFETVEQCFEHKRGVDKNPSVNLELYFEGKTVTNIEYGCVRYLKNYVEECEVLPMDPVKNKECIPYWNHWATHSRSERGTYYFEPIE